MDRKYKMIDDILLDDAPFRSDGSQDAIKEGSFGGSFGVLILRWLD